mgnify:CR=1 FL=1
MLGYIRETMQIHAATEKGSGGNEYLENRSQPFPKKKLRRLYVLSKFG